MCHVGLMILLHMFLLVMHQTRYLLPGDFFHNVGRCSSTLVGNVRWLAELCFHLKLFQLYRYVLYRPGCQAHLIMFLKKFWLQLSPFPASMHNYFYYNKESYLEIQNAESRLLSIPTVNDVYQKQSSNLQQMDHNGTFLAANLAKLRVNLKEDPRGKDNL